LTTIVGDDSFILRTNLFLSETFMHPVLPQFDQQRRVGGVCPLLLSVDFGFG
jgi:hypothetical protein